MKYMLLIHQGTALDELERLPEDEKSAVYRHEIGAVDNYLGKHPAVFAAIGRSIRTTRPVRRGDTRHIAERAVKPCSMFV